MTLLRSLSCQLPHLPFGPQASVFTTSRFSTGATFRGLVNSSHVTPLFSDSKLNEKCEDLLYFLKDILPGSLIKAGVAKERFLAAYKILSADILVQDPLLCMRGIKCLRRWLKILAQAGVVVDLHEIYMQGCRTDPSKCTFEALHDQNSLFRLLLFGFHISLLLGMRKHSDPATLLVNIGRRWVYALWTLSFMENLETIRSSRLPSWWTEQFDRLLEDSCSDQTVVGTGQGNLLLSCSSQINDVLRLSGESKFEMDSSGQVISITSSWYVKKDGKKMYEAVKILLASLVYLDNNQT